MHVNPQKCRKIHFFCTLEEHINYFRIIFAKNLKKVVKKFAKGQKFDIYLQKISRKSHFFVKKFAKPTNLWAYLCRILNSVYQNIYY